MTRAIPRISARPVPPPANWVEFVNQAMMARELEGLRPSAQPRELENVDSKAFRIGVNTAVAAPSIREYSDVGLPYNVRKKGGKLRARAAVEKVF